MCKSTLATKRTVITDKIIFCFLCDFSPSHSEHGQSGKIKAHETPNINAENTNNHGSNHSGTNAECATSGANNPTSAKTIGKTQQNKCGKIDAIIPILTALFFICVSFVCFLSVFAKATAGHSIFLIVPFVRN